jgi:hypothetical protein
MREFIAVDPGGNWIRIGQLLATADRDQAEPGLQDVSTDLSRATHAASLLERAGDYAAAVARLDGALVRDDEGEPASHRLQALVVRAGLAVTMNDLELGRNLLSSARDLRLLDAERTALTDELERMSELEQLTETMPR